MLRSLVDKCLFVIRPGLTTPEADGHGPWSAFKESSTFLGAVLNRSIATLQRGVMFTEIPSPHRCMHFYSNLGSATCRLISDPRATRRRYCSTTGRR